MKWTHCSFKWNDVSRKQGFIPSDCICILNPIETHIAGQKPAKPDTFNPSTSLEFSMKTVATTLIISAAMFAGAAQAEQTTTVTRAQVVAELQQARESGQLTSGELNYPPAIVSSESKSRDQVLAELAAARAAGELSQGELDYPPVAAAESTKTRAQVVNELHEYLASGNVEQVEA